MDKRLYDVLNDREGNHMLPFLWMHEGRHDNLPGLVQQIYDSGARAFCVESRPHEQFCRQEWWDDMDVILAEARKRDMKVWILDDRHFPTGFANGLISEKYPHLRKWQLIEEHTDMVGPAPQSAMLLGENEEDHLIGVYAYHRSEAAETLDAEPIDLTANVH